MHKPGIRTWLAGLILHVLLGAMLIGAGSMKVFVPMSEADLGPVAKTPIKDQLTLIGTGEIITGVLIILPWTASLGVLLMSGFWGGTIVFHMMLPEAYPFQAGMLLATWLGACLRMPEMFSSFWTPPPPPPSA